MANWFWFVKSIQIKSIKFAYFHIFIFIQLTLFCTTLLVCAGIRSMYIFICKICWILWGPFFKKYIMLLICAQKPNLPKLCHQRALNYLHSKQFLCFIFRKTRKYPLHGYFVGVLANTTAWYNREAWFWNKLLRIASSPNSVCICI